MRRFLRICSIALPMLIAACSSTTHDDIATEDALNTDDAKIASIFNDKVNAPGIPSVRGYSLYRVRLTERNAKAFDKLLDHFPHCKPGSAVRDCWAYKTNLDTHLHAIGDHPFGEMEDEEDRENAITVNVIADADRNFAAFALHAPNQAFSQGIETLEFGWLKGKEALFGDLVQVMRARAQAQHAWPVSIHMSGNEPMALDGEDQEKATRAAVTMLEGMGLTCRPNERNDWGSDGSCELRQGTPWFR